MLLVGVVLLLAFLANLLGRALFCTGNFALPRAVMSGVIVATALSCGGIFYGGRYLGGNVVFTGDVGGLYYLMYEGWGMMFIPLSILFGFVAMVREGWESHP